MRLALRGQVSERQRHAHRPHGDRASHQPQPVGADLQDVAGVDRQQRGHAAEQNGKKVERDGAEHHRLAPQVKLVAVLAFGVMANVCYFLGPVAEIAFFRIWGRRALPTGPTLFRMGLTFSVGLALLPTLITVFDYGFRLLRWLVA